MDNIVLCGFMGCGKTTVGRNLARKSGRKFVDMDSYIEEKAGMKVSEIFEKYGENRFRDMEHEACLELADTKGLVIASGGGAFTFQRNIDAFRGKDKIVLLDVPLDIIKDLKTIQQDRFYSVPTRMKQCVSFMKSDFRYIFLLLT